MAISTSTRPEGLWTASQGTIWLSTGKAGTPGEFRSGSEMQGWHDAGVAAVLFNIECNDSYVASFLLNLPNVSRV